MRVPQQTPDPPNSSEQRYTLLMHARISKKTPLLYSQGADNVRDRPHYVRAGSGLAWVQSDKGARLAVCQDDAAFVALVDPRTRRVDAITLPAGKGGARQFDSARNNKMDKFDLESACVLPTAGGDRLFLFGSGSAAVREVALELNVDTHAVTVHSTSVLCAALRAALPAGTELNIEGTCMQGDTLVLLQRGNGKGAVDAVCRSRWPEVLRSFQDGTPPAVRVTRARLGTIAGVQLTFTDACAQGPNVLFLAAAEKSPNAIDDGEVVGCAIGIWRSDDTFTVTPLLDEDGEPYMGKPEGLCVVNDRTWVVTDADNATQPSLLLDVTLVLD